MNERRSTQRIQLGMVVWNGLPAALPQAGSAIGGLETGAWTLAEGIAKYTSVQPKFVVRATGRQVVRQINQVDIVVRREPLASIRNHVAKCIEIGPPPRLRKFSPSLLWQLPVLAIARPLKGPRILPMQPDPRLLDIDVDVWAGFGVSGDSARVAATARSQRRPMILFLESNADLDPRLATNEDFVNAYGETSEQQRFALAQASVIVCQSNFQKALLAEHFKREGVLLRNPILRENWQVQPRHSRNHVLWIGRYDTFHKRPHLAMEIARRCPNLNFKMIINRQDQNVEAEIRRNLPANVQLLDYVPFSEMKNQFADAFAFLCTGSPEHEGFPNVLLQAAAAHTPICSLSDFDHFITTSGSGVVCNNDLEKAAATLKLLAESDDIDWLKVDRYLDDNHSLAAVSESVASLVRELIQSVVSE